MMEEDKEFEHLREEVEKKEEAEHEKPSVQLGKEEKAKLEEGIVMLNAREQEEADKEVYRGVLLFFCNKMEEAEKVFKTKSDTELLYSNALGAIAFLKAIVSFSDTDITYASDLLARTTALSDVYTNVYKSKSSFVTKLFSFYSPASQPVPNGELRAAVIRAESSLLTGLMQLFQENVVGYIKAGLNLRKGYKELSTCYDQLRAAGDPTTYDVHTVGGVYFNFGAINVVLASLPGPILKLVSFFGFSCDRELGFELLHKAFDAGGARSPLASLFLLTLYIILPAFIPAWANKYIPLAEGVLTESLTRYPKGALFLWLAGRLYRSKRDLDKAIEAFEESSNCYGDNFAQLKHLCFYDLGLSYLWKLNWQTALEYFERLAQENYWSKAFYAFQWGVCSYMIGEKEKAIELFKTVPTFVVRKFGGRTISVEQYVVKKVKMFEMLDYELGALPGMEMIYLWNGFACMSQETLQKCLSIVEESLKQLEEDKKKKDEDRKEKLKTSGGGSNNSPSLFRSKSDGPTGNPDFFVDQKSMLLLIKCSILHNLGKDRIDDAFDALTYIFENEAGIVEDTFIPPFAYYELGTLHYLDDNISDAKDAFAKAKDYKKFSFEFRLLLILHLSGIELAKAKK